eukprot:8852028-Alexandrium_andersonii.AAC.1
MNVPHLVVCLAAARKEVLRLRDVRVRDMVRLRREAFQRKLDDPKGGLGQAYRAVRKAPARPL